MIYSPAEEHCFGKTLGVRWRNAIEVVDRSPSRGKGKMRDPQSSPWVDQNAQVTVKSNDFFKNDLRLPFFLKGNLL